jgi:4-amino-4-deoxy-L-arabinose transferase-like glycosyltransferase
LSFDAARWEWRTLLLAAGATAALALLWVAPPDAQSTGDERDYLRAATHLARSSVLSSAPLDQGAPRPDAYREPAYPFLLSVWWRASGELPPAAASDRVVDPAWRTVPGVRGLGCLALAVAAGAAGVAARSAGVGLSAAIAATALVAASPGLRQAALTMGPEALAAAFVALVGCGLVRTVGGGGYGSVALAGVAAGLGVLTRGAGVAVLPVGALVLLAFPVGASPRSRLARAAVFGLIALLPCALWAARNRAVTGHWVLGDRGGQVMWTRAELNRELAAEGLAPALLAWTPVQSARDFGERRWPAARYSRYEWTGEGNFFTRSIRRWRSDRNSLGDVVAADRALGREALREFLARPGDHALAGVAVAWRGSFAERSPSWLAPVDLRFVLGLISAIAPVLLLVTGLFRRDARALALVAAPLALFSFHGALTEFLTRFSVPSLPLAWAALVVALSPRTPPRANAAAPAAPSD